MPRERDAARAALLFATRDVGAGVLDAALRYVSVNTALAAMNGRPADAHVGEHVADVLPPDVAHAVTPVLERVLATGEPLIDVDLPADVPGGAAGSFSVSYHPIAGADGDRAGIAILATQHGTGEREQRAGAERLRRIMESGVVGLFFWTLDGGIVEANDAFLHMLGYTQADLAEGRVDWRRLTPPEYAAQDELFVQQLNATGRHGLYQKEYLGRDGRRVPVVITSAMLQGSTDRGLCICIDDTARRAAEDRLARVLRQTPAAVAVLLGPEHVVHSTNEMFLRLLGRRDYAGRPAREGAPELETQGFLARMDEVYRTGLPFEGREAPLLWDRDGDGTLVEGYFDFIYQPLVEPSGAVEGILVFAVEVTAQVRAREATERAAQRTERLQSLTSALAGARSVDEAAAVVVAQGVTATGAHTGMLAMLQPGAPEAVIVRQTGLTDDVVARYARFALTAPGPSARCLRTGDPQWAATRDEVLAHYPEIPEIWATLGTQALACTPLAVAGEIVGAITFTFDAPRTFGAEEREFFVALGRQAAQAVERARLFAAERAARDAAERARIEAEAANRAKSEFLAVMSHELRTPLNAIGGYAELLEMGIRGAVTPQQREDLARIRRSQQHLLGLINEVLNYARLESGSVRYDLTEVGVAGLLGSVESLVAPQARAKGLTLHTAPCDPALTVRADAEKVRQVLLNLLSNAVKFTDAGGRVTVETHVRRDGRAPRVEITVADTGVGIASDQLDAVFEPFVQVGRALNNPGEGTGLGLAISRDLARGMGGELVAASTPGAGSRFVLSLPVG